MDGHVLFRTDRQLSVSSQTLFGTEHTLKLKEKNTESIVIIFSVSMSATCKCHTHICDTKLDNALEMHMNAVIGHFKYQIIHIYLIYLGVTINVFV